VVRANFPLFPYQKKVSKKFQDKNQGIRVPNFIEIAWKLGPLDTRPYRDTYRHPTKEKIPYLVESETSLALSIIITLNPRVGEFRVSYWVHTTYFYKCEKTPEGMRFFEKKMSEQKKRYMCLGKVNTWQFTVLFVFRWQRHTKTFRTFRHSFHFYVTKDYISHLLFFLSPTLPLYNSKILITSTLLPWYHG